MIWLNLKHFFNSIANILANIFTIIIGILAYLIGYPAQIAILSAALILFALDILTKVYAISCQNNGIAKAFINKKITSRSFINGVITKAIGYFVILTIANLSLITPQVSIVGGIFANILYVSLFTYEALSNLENLRDAGFTGSKSIIQKIRREHEKL